MSLIAATFSGGAVSEKPDAVNESRALSTEN
jgi:hypothetical protein